MTRSLLLLIPALLLTACQSMLPKDGNVLFRKLPGGTFVLHREVVIAPGLAHITFQDGAAAYGASEFHPRCELEVKFIMDTPQTIPAGSYRIGAVRGLQRYVNRPPGGIRLANAGDTLQLADSGTDEWLMHTYWMQLLRDEQEDTPNLICGGAYGFPYYAHYPTLQEIRDSLGNLATLTLREPLP